MIVKLIKSIFSNNIEIDEFDPEKINLEKHKQELEHLQKTKNNHLNNLKIAEGEKKQIEKEGVVHYNFVSFSILVLITIGLTLYLFVFYSSTIYSSFYGNVDSNLGGFIRASVFTEASEKGTGATAIIILAPFIFIGLGFLIHSALRENRLREVRRKKKTYILIASLISMTFLFDALMAYKISESIHNDLYLKGLTDVQWVYNLALTDINFWLVLFSGFVVYVIWGLLLDKVMMDFEKTQVPEAIKNLDMEIEKTKSELSELNSKIESMQNLLSKHN